MSVLLEEVRRVPDALELELEVLVSRLMGM